MSSKVQKAIAAVGPDVLGFAGLCLVVYGVSQFSRPAAAIISGALLLFIGIRLGKE